MGAGLQPVGQRTGRGPMARPGSSARAPLSTPNLPRAAHGTIWTFRGWACGVRRVNRS